MPRIVTAMLDEADLRRTLNESRGELTTIYLESETRIVLAPLGDFLGPKISLPPVPWLTGRAFGPKLEIRWNMDENRFEAAALSESGNLPNGWQDSPWNSLLDQETRQRDVLLVGVNSIELPQDHTLYRAKPEGGLWIETRIPKPLYYPVDDAKAKRVMLRCVDYLSRGLVVLSRLTGFDPSKQ